MDITNTNKTLVIPDEKYGISIYLIHYDQFNEYLNTFLNNLNTYLLAECNGVVSIDDIRNNTSQYYFYIVSDKNHMVLSSFCFKKIYQDKFDFELWAVCRHRHVYNQEKNITMVSLRKVIQKELQSNDDVRIWLCVIITDKNETLKLISSYSDIGFTNKFINLPNETSPSGINVGKPYQTMILDKNTIRINQNMRNKSNFIWDYYNISKEKVSFYLKKQFVGILRESIKLAKEYSFKIELKEKATNIYEISMTEKGIAWNEGIKVEDKYEWSKNCHAPAEIDAFSHIHTHPRVCDEVQGGFLKINPISVTDINAMLRADYRFLLVPSKEGLHFLTLTEVFRKNLYKIYTEEQREAFIKKIVNKYSTETNTKLLKVILKKKKKEINLFEKYYLINLYKKILSEDFFGIFYYKFFEWTDSDLFLYKEEIIH
jgi:hypothetical protein